MFSPSFCNELLRKKCCLDLLFDGLKNHLHVGPKKSTCITFFFFFFFFKLPIKRDNLNMSNQCVKVARFQSKYLIINLNVKAKFQDLAEGAMISIVLQVFKNNLNLLTIMFH